ncbi:hypothetical protein KOCBH_A00399 (plasmid) [Klebsiella michiganensis]|nr:hypothetical protein KOCBH_A00399 [Klebsiella michiganensis]
MISTVPLNSDKRVFLLNQLEDLIGFIATNEFRVTSINQFIEVEASELMVISLWHPMCPDITEVHFLRDMDKKVVALQDI